MSKLSDQLQAASWRGVPFFVEAARVTGGRRVEVHEYPKRDKSYAEDNGKATRRLTVRGFVIGADYIQQAQKLLDAMETKGPGTLVHPWHGTMTCSLEQPGSIDYDQGLGVASVEMQFVESGELAYPSAATSTGKQSRLAADGLNGAIATDFSGKFRVDGFPDFVSGAARGDLGAMLGLAGGSKIPGLSQLGYLTSAGSTLTAATSFLSNPTALANSLLNFFGVSGLALGSLNLSSAIQSLLRLRSSSTLQAAPAPYYNTPSRQQQRTNTDAINSLARQAALTQAVGLSSVMPATVYDDTIIVRDQLVTALDDEMLTASDEVYQAMNTARNAVWTDLTDRAQEGARLREYTPPTTMPALVLAYDLFEDAGRETELLERNGVRHPGFVPVAPLKVLST